MREEDLGALLPLVRAYREFYEVAPPDADVLALCRALIADPAREGDRALPRRRDRARRRLAAVECRDGHHRAQAVYDHVGGRRSRWLDYDLDA